MLEYQNNPEDDIELYKNHDGGSDPDVDDTEQYGKTIYLGRYDTITIDNKFAENIGTSGTDQLLARIYRRRNPNWEGDEALIKEVDCGNTSGTKSIIIDATKSGPGYYRIGNLVNGTTNHFNVNQQGRMGRVS
jgi:hypothetical protein